MLYWPQRAGAAFGPRRKQPGRSGHFLRLPPSAAKNGGPSARRKKGGADMLTAILSLSQLRGAQLWLVFWLALAALYFALMLGVPPLRRKAGAKNILLAFLAAAMISSSVAPGFP